eukprot:TRINITY_DN9827_c0_g1_i1.p1 TRINITY_DN9827_c0_g1~~TRINITY_DN9827_c0_g1_i1.p1  ORF type:complete len:228 (-),score=30.36 TRINITY_DN9827_c0_g1_i1:219-902(-)
MHTVAVLLFFVNLVLSLLRLKDIMFKVTIGSICLYCEVFANILYLFRFSTNIAYAYLNYYNRPLISASELLSTTPVPFFLTASLLFVFFWLDITSTSNYLFYHLHHPHLHPGNLFRYLQIHLQYSLLKHHGYSRRTSLWYSPHLYHLLKLLCTFQSDASQQTKIPQTQLYLSQGHLQHHHPGDYLHIGASEFLSYKECGRVLCEEGLNLSLLFPAEYESDYCFQDQT